jgi:hypothetical protein
VRFSRRGSGGGQNEQAFQVRDDHEERELLAADSHREVLAKTADPGADQVRPASRGGIFRFAKGRGENETRKK